MDNNNNIVVYRNNNNNKNINKYQNEIALLKLSTGILLILYPDLFPATFLLYSGIRAIGLHQLRDQSMELIETYRRVKVTFLTNLPAIKDNFNKLSILEMKLEEVNDNFSNGRLDEFEYQRQLDSLTNEMEILKVLISDLSRAFNQISESAEHDKFKDLSIKIYSTLYMCIATASSVNAATFTIGMNIGKVVSNRINMFLNAHKDQVKLFANRYINQLTDSVSSPTLQQLSKDIEGEKIVATGVDIASSIIGLVSSYFMQSFARTINTCFSGAELIVSGIEDIFDPTLRYSSMYTLLQGSIMFIGITRILAGHSKPTGLMQIILSPLNILEISIQAIFIKELKIK
jgi:hypothetical protein